MSSPSLFVSVFPLSVLFSLSMFFSFLLSLFLPYFFSLSFFFFLSLFSLSSPISSTLSSPVFIGKKQGERGLLPLSSRGTGIGWPRQPPQGCPRGSSPLFFRLVVGHGSEFKQMMGLLSASFWVFFLERRKGADAGEDNSSSPASACAGEEEDPQCHSKRHHLGLFFFFSFFFETVDETASFHPKHVVSFKRKWRKKHVRIQISTQLQF